ncbi:DUF1825 family protein [Anthocerotibacter panamensis]|uniref:DUF1825 family protein n=1 Tax=Anthocerotibacter panamensis TaxID=2857077 RepID=UPI001C406B3A|nr:DUF1825 family protein [Anthocerotibacter panamensis]
MGFFDSPIVQEEAHRFMVDYQSLVALGSNYGKFDRVGKEMYIQQMEELLDRYSIFMKRMDLSDDFQAQVAMKDLQEQLKTFGIQPQQMFEHMTLRLRQMKQEIR